MSPTDTSDPAFPCPELSQQHFGHRGAYSGMTLRDYFAGQALAGLLASPRATQEWIAEHGPVSCYGIADAMLKERAK